MFATHTPGPWHISGTEIRGRVHPDSSGVFERVATIEPVSRKHRLADGETESRSDPDTERANARLIAAAPELLAALLTLAEAVTQAVDRGLLEEAPLDPRTALDAQEWMRDRLHLPARQAHTIISKALGHGR